MPTKFGYSGLIENQNGINSEGVLNTLLQNTNKMFTGRVLDINLDEKSEIHQYTNRFNGIGAIKYEYVENVASRSNQSIKYAYPLLPSQKQFPLVNELVIIFLLPDNKLDENNSLQKAYYLNTLALWNHPHHNAYPSPFTDDNQSPSQNHDYQQIEGGLVRRVTDDSTEIDLNGQSKGTFVEQTNIKPILPFAGDVILEGRFGNSIRLGNTSKTTSTYKNNWSDFGDNGNPITIIKNGQPDNVGNQGWLPTTEDINKDKSSIYLTSNQKIPIVTSSENYSAFTEAPLLPRLYKSNQILLSSGRLVFNAATDSILMSSQKNISLSSQMNIGLTSNQDVSLVGNFVRLGSSDAKQALVKGDDFMARFDVLLSNLIALCDVLEQATQTKIDISGNIETGPHPTISVTAPIVKGNLEDIKNELPSLLSQVSKTV